METRLGGAQVLELEASYQVVRQDTNLLPGAVGSIVVGGDHIQSKLPFDFGESFLLGSTSGNKPHRTQFNSSLIVSWEVQGHHDRFQSTSGVTQNVPFWGIPFTVLKTHIYIELF